MSHLIAETCRASRMTGRKRGLGLEVPSKKKYRCNAAGCTVTPRGCDLPKHYKTKTNWDKVIKLRAVMGTAALERQLSAVGESPTVLGAVPESPNQNFF